VALTPRPQSPKLGRHGSIISWGGSKRPRRNWLELGGAALGSLPLGTRTWIRRSNAAHLPGPKIHHIGAPAPFQFPHRVKRFETISSAEPLRKRGRPLQLTRRSRRSKEILLLGAEHDAMIFWSAQQQIVCPRSAAAVCLTKLGRRSAA